MSDVFPNLPEGSRAWIWDASDQKFVEGLDQRLPPGQACLLYVPVPVLLVVTGQPNLLQSVSIDLEKGWNLIGVPYDTALLRSGQHVYVHWARKTFNDAVAEKDLGSSIFSFDSNGYETVAEGGSFEPLHGYWVYAGRAELLELTRPGLAEGAGFSWTSVLSPVAGFVESTVLTQMGLSDTAKLIEITGKLDQLQTSLNGLNAKLDTVLNALGVVEADILQEIGHDTLVAPVQVALASHYDQENAGASLAWFVKQAKSGSGMSVSTQVKSEFARQVLNDWAFIDKFNSINAAILPATGNRGVLDNFAERVVLTSDDYALKDHYVGMETYYSTLVAMQIKCATLILSAYDQLGSDPAWSSQYPAPNTAAEWKKNVFDPTIKAETEAFLRAAENVAVRKLPVPTTASDPQVKVPDYVQVVLGMADAFVMGLLNPIYPDQEPVGLRLRVAVNPSADLPKLQWIAATGNIIYDLTHGGQIVLPPFSEWRTAFGDVEYDDWILDPALKPAAFQGIPAFHVTKAWRLTRVIFPSRGTFSVFPVGSSPFWGLIRATTASSTSVTGFGSLTLAVRPSTREMFDPCNVRLWTSANPTLQYTNECGNPADASRLSPCDTINFAACQWFHSAVTLSYRFGYAGTILEPGPGGAARPGTWKADGTYATTDTYCRTDFSYEFSEGDTVKNTTFNIQPPPVTPQNYSFTWQPGTIYTFRVKLIGDPINDGLYPVPACSATWEYQGANITFP